MSKDDASIIHIVDDDDAVRDSISMLLDTMGLEHEVYASALDFLQQTDESVAGVLVLDIRMPGMSGLELQQRLIEDGRTIPIIFISGHGDIPMAVQAMKNGAIDFIRKPFRQQELLDRINEALSASATEREKSERLEAHRAAFETLTPREREVFGRVATGQANKVVAIDLGISERTVEIHRSQVMRKMHARTLADLVRMQIRLEQA